MRTAILVSLSVAIGHFLGLTLPQRPIALAAALDFLAFAVGAVMHKRLPEQFLHGLASVLFLLFGLWIQFDTALGLKRVAVGIATIRLVRGRTAASAAVSSLDPSVEPVKRSAGY